MKGIRLVKLLVLLVLTTASQAQNILDPVSWDIKIEKTGENTADIILEAIIDPGWHLYSQKQFGAEFEGPIATEISFNDAVGSFELSGQTQEPDVEPIFDEVFELDVVYFEDVALFRQSIIILDPATEIQATVFYSVCDDEKCLQPETKTLKINLGGERLAVESVELSERDREMAQSLEVPLKGVEQFELNQTKEKSLWNIFLLGFLGGLIALLTPCVFPMIPLTVSFFTKSAKNKQNALANAMLYGFFIFIIYVLLSLPFHLVDSLDPEILNNISTNVTLNIIFFVIFLVFAFSFFGYYEITLPSSWSTKMDQKANSFGGIIGIFFMALTLAIVSFSCTGPILGSLLGGSLSSDGGATQLSMGMAGFGLALALPFGLFALFPNWLNRLPSSGGWLNTVKVVLGFMELALAFKFLSNADLVEHWGILKREIFIAIWMICALGMALYLFGFIRFPHDGPKKKPLPKGNVLVGTLSILFFLYLTPGLTNTERANLKLLSGFPPPLFYSIYDKGTSAPLGLEAYKDFEQGVAAAKAASKPIMIDFTGWACVNCRKMEEQVWSIPEVFEVISKDFVLISLYVDDRKSLPEEQQFNYQKPNGTVKLIKTIGDKWSTFQTLNFENNSQPYYVLMDANFKLLSQPAGYTPDGDEFLDWLNKGKANYIKPIN